MKFLGTYIDDAKASSRCFRAFLDAGKKKRKRKKEEKALKRAYHDIGTKAADKEKAKERKSYGSVEEDRAEAEKLEAALGEKRAEEQAVKEEIAARGEECKAEIGKVDEEHRRLAAAHKEAKEALAVFVRKMREIDDELERPAEKKKTDRSAEDLRAELESLKPGREEAKEKEQAAKAVRDGKKEELDAARKAWKEEETGLTKKHWALIDERESMERTVEAARSELDGSLEDLGKSVALAGMTDPDFAEPLKQAREHMGEIQALTKGIEERRAEMRSVKTESTRFTLVTFGILVLIAGIVVAIVALTGGDDGKKKKDAEGAPPPAGAATLPAPSGPGEETAEGKPGADLSRPPAGVELTPELRDAVLALDLFAGEDALRPDGEMTLAAAGDAADGGSWLEIDVPAARPAGPDAVPERVVVHVRVIVGGAGRVVASRVVGITDEGTMELDRLLEGS